MPFNYDQLKTRQRAEQEAEVNGIENLSHKILWEQFPNSIPLLIGNRYARHGFEAEDSIWMSLRLYTGEAAVVASEK